MSVIDIGQPAPYFEAPASNGKTVSLKDYSGKKIVVLYFYPKDDTPGCTTEACGFRDDIQNFEDQGAIVLGVSPDPLAKHQKFIEKYGLPFILLSDEDHAVSESYGVWVEKSMYGHKYMGIERSTFIIGKDGKILKVLRKVKPAVHIGEVLETLATNAA